MSLNDDNLVVRLVCDLADIHTKLQQIESNTEGGGTTHLSHSIKQVEDVANRAFSPLLERQAQVERIRSVQGMLQRFRTLFNLPSSIRTYISKGEYEQAIREYKKAKSLDLYSNVRGCVFVESIVKECYMFILSRWHL